MTQQQLRDLVRASNPVVHPDQLLPEERDLLVLYAEAMYRAGNPHASTDLLERPVERRRDVQTQQLRPESDLATRRPMPRRRLIPALAGAMAVLALAVGLWAVTRTTEPVVGDRSPLEVTDLYNQAVADGDWAAVRALYADSAEMLVENATDTVVPRVAVIDYEPRTPYDWDGDGLVNGFDGLIDDGASQFAGGTTTFLSCSQADAATVVCDQVWEGYAFRRQNHVPTTWTFTIVEGLIELHAIGLPVRSVDPVDRAAVQDYHQWVSDNRPELEADLFEDSETLVISPDSVGTHRELIAEWQAVR